MASRTLRTNLVLTLTFVLAACGNDDSTDATTFTGADDVEGTADNGTLDTADETGSSADTTGGDGDGDTATTSDDDIDTTMDGSTMDDTTTADETTDGTDDSMECLDLDQDGYGDNCEMGPDCDDADYNNHTVEGCANCADADGDNYWVGCDTFDEAKQGPDCDDADFNVFSDEGCANCTDADGDNYWVGCDQYGNMKPGPDCADDNPAVGVDDAEEICNGLAENCAGEIDHAPPDEMCPTMGDDPPGVSPMNGWICDPPAPGVDGCQIANCVEQFFDLDEQIPNGCECEATPRTESLAACSGAPQGYLGDAGEGEQIIDLVVGSVPLIDNGIGSGNEDWYWVEFPAGGNPGVRPNTGSIRVDFEQNDGNDYRFAVHRSCNGVAFDQGLATQFGAGAPPVREWWFFDNHTPAVQMPVPALYIDNVSWPSTVYIRVFRVQNDKTCNHYKLRIQRVAN
jgi:hypothetical protein